MDVQPVPPLVLLEQMNYQGIFPSALALLNHVEAIDVRDGIYTVFDATGRRVLLEAATDTRPLVLAGLALENEPDTLRAALPDTLRRTGGCCSLPGTGATASWRRCRFGR